jgi:diaminohydroxyphosphoribosylaminopyrimidine deaminase/5-amino-6-(5-phosphoribosylamino)uracil reductase
MEHALVLARRGLGRTYPNPAVGAVLVKGDHVVGEGFHRRAGGPHAEVEALAAAGRAAKGSVLYVTLEPCTHTGRTGPCVEALARVGLRRVVVAVHDPNPRVRGRGVRSLRASGIRVDVGTCGAEAAALIAGYRSLVLRGRPRVVLKLATSLDGRIALADGSSKWITGPEARRAGHRLRRESDAVLVGAGTVRADDPRLTCRVRGGGSPVRIVLSGPDANVSPEARVFAGRRPGLLLVPRGASPRRLARLADRGVEIVEAPTRRRRIPLETAMRVLGERGLTQVLVEGGRDVATGALRAGVVDRVVWFLAPSVLGGDAIPAIGTLRLPTITHAPTLRIDEVTRVGNDVMILATPR